jgi:hypothetical protein
VRQREAKCSGAGRGDGQTCRMATILAAGHPPFWIGQHGLDERPAPIPPIVPIRTGHSRATPVPDLREGIGPIGPAFPRCGCNAFGHRWCALGVACPQRGRSDEVGPDWEKPWFYPWWGRKSGVCAPQKIRGGRPGLLRGYSPDVGNAFFPKSLARGTDDAVSAGTQRKTRLPARAQQLLFVVAPGTVRV